MLALCGLTTGVSLTRSVLQCAGRYAGRAGAAQRVVAHLAQREGDEGIGRRRTAHPSDGPHPQAVLRQPVREVPRDVGSVHHTEVFEKER